MIRWTRSAWRALPRFAVPVACLTLSQPGWADGRGDGGGHEPVRLLTTIPIPPTASNTSGGLYVFDISFVDPDNQLYYLSDRSNAVLDVIDTRANTLVAQLKGGFKGFTGNNNTSGPNGVVVAGRFVVATDSPSRVVSIDPSTGQVVSTASTGGAAGLRADEIAYDPTDGLLLAVNNADTPPFATLIKIDGSGQLTVGKRISFADATNGAEQPAWDPVTHRFFQSIPEVNGPGDGTGPNGAVARISAAGTLEAELPVQLCQPAGLSHGPGGDLLLGCSVAFDTAGKAWTTTDTLSAAPQHLILDTRIGGIDAQVPGVTGSDEVWFNAGDRRYYTASRSNPSGPVLGVIDADMESLVQLVPTISVPAVANLHPAGTVHSVAADPRNNHVFVPLPANNALPNCLQGCVAVFGTGASDDQGRDVSQR